MLFPLLGMTKRIASNTFMAPPHPKSTLSNSAFWMNLKYNSGLWSNIGKISALNDIINSIMIFLSYVKMHFFYERQIFYLIG